MKNEVKKVWKKEKDGFLNDYKKGIIVIKKDEDGNITINHKMYESEVIKTHWSIQNIQLEFMALKD